MSHDRGNVELCCVAQQAESQWNQAAYGNLQHNSTRTSFMFATAAPGLLLDVLTPPPG
jgi:hypothetical protein